MKYTFAFYIQSAWNWNTLLLFHSSLVIKYCYSVLVIGVYKAPNYDERKNISKIYEEVITSLSDRGPWQNCNLQIM